MENFLETDTTPDMFPEYPQPPTTFTVGMKIEAVDPLNLATICVATVMKVSYWEQRFKSFQLSQVLGSTCSNPVGYANCLAAQV
jgi:hypothetical protein